MENRVLNIPLSRKKNLLLCEHYNFEESKVETKKYMFEKKTIDNKTE